MPIYIRGFIYTHIPTTNIRAVYDTPLFDTVCTIELQCTFSVEDRQQSINQKVQIKGNCWACNGFVYGDIVFADF